jgi:hypothetical protein
MTVLHTQSSSKPRLKNDTLGDDSLQQLYSAYKSMPTDQFRLLATELVQSGGGKQPMKDKIIAGMQVTDKAKILSKAQNFILAGMGLGV